MEPIILASGSLRRQEYFRMLGLPFSIMPSRIDETLDSSLRIVLQAEDLARRKVKSVIGLLQDRRPPWILGADTLIASRGTVFGKPADREDARRMLMELSGSRHEVTTALALYNGKTGLIDCRSCSSAVEFIELSEYELEWYLSTGEWQGVAGAYRIQGVAGCFAKEIHGSYSSIVGLPLHVFYAMLRQNGYSLSGS